MAQGKISIPAFRRLVWAHYKKSGRHDLPWRKTKDPYRILISEVMLQQTQVERVVPFYKNFIREFPRAEQLATAPLSEVLKAWQGLGYNRRAKMLREAAKGLAGKKKLSVADLEALPGVGPYTARAVAAFSYNEDAVFIETNIRTLVIHHFFKNKKMVSDTEIEKVLSAALPKGKAREWYSALMDYGSFLKRSGTSHNARSRSYTKQAVFKGSLREARGAILRGLLSGSASRSTIERLLGPRRIVQMREAIEALEKEGLVTISKGRLSLSDV